MFEVLNSTSGHACVIRAYLCNLISCETSTATPRRQYEELAPYAARIQGLLLLAWEISTCLREIMVETVIARQVEVRLYSKVRIASARRR